LIHFYKRGKKNLKMCGLGCIKFFNIALCLTGIALSAYAYYVEFKYHESEEYVPACDISEDISCSVVFTSEWGTGFGLVSKYLGSDHPLNKPNSLYGIAFYSLMLLLSLINRKFIARIQTMLSVGSLVVSCYLGYILYFILKDLCVVCVATYAVNFLLFAFSVCKGRNIPAKVVTKYGYYIPKTNTPLNNNADFKKFI